MIKCIYVDRIKMIGKTPDCVDVVALLLLAILLISPSTSAQSFGTIPAPTLNNLQVFALPVGQGDCTIIQCPNGNIIVYDCGSAGGDRLTAYGVERWLDTSIDRVSYILITHPHADHHSYLPEISWNYTTLRGIIIGGQLDNYVGDTRNWLNNNINRVHLVNNGQRCIGNNPVCAVNINTGTNFCNNQNYQFSILAANVRNNPNQMSIVMRVAFGGWSMLLSGDMEGTALNDITNQLGGGLQSVVYKMSHHGATRANTAQWVSQINPRYAFASSGYNYGICRHPTCTAVATLLANSSIDMTAPPHPFYCGNGPFLPTDYANYRYNILETSPNDTDICLLTYESDVTIQPVAACIQPMFQAQTQFTNETAYSEEECNDPTAEGGGALCVAASYFVLATVILLCFIIV